MTLGALLCAITACQPPRQPLEIRFAARLGEAPLECNASAAGPQLTDLRLFVYDFRLRERNGNTVPMELDDESPWQGEQVALLDFENGEGACRNGSVAVNARVHGTVEPGDYTGLSFRIGVPEALNHDDPLRASPPLNIPDMHWHWLAGYKFLRAGLVDDEDGFWVHVGSTRCAGSATEPQGCRNSNRPRVELPQFLASEDLVVFDFQPLARSVDLTDGVPSDCSSGPTEATCAAPFAVLGLDFPSGQETGTPAFVRVTKKE